MLLAHFRMTGEWEVGSTAHPPPVHARVLVEFDDGVRLTLVDPRALSTVTLHRPGEEPIPELGPDPLSDAFDRVWLRSTLRARRIPIKVALLDQRVAAGVGNIYAAEALWVARIGPRVSSASLGVVRLSRLSDAVRQVLRHASGERRSAYGGRGGFAVYGREGEPCPRCGSRIRRILQAGRSTYFCPRCQPG
jgi:formamidopyrimidine-DNA glycosylase